MALGPQGFRLRVQGLASAVVRILTRIGTTCQYSARGTPAVTLVCWSSGIKRRNIVYNKVLCQEMEEIFWIPRQTNFPPTVGDVTVSDTLVDENGINFQSLEWDDKDGVRAVYRIKATSILPKQSGDIE